MPGDHSITTPDDETNPAYLREILKYVVDIGASLRLHMDTDTLLKRIVTTACQALRFRYAVCYLFNRTGFFYPAASSGINTSEEEYLRQHPLPEAVVERLLDEQYRISDSYFLPVEAAIWQETTFVSYFVVVKSSNEHTPALPTGNRQIWHPEDLLVVPLRAGDGQLLGFLTPDAPLNGLRPTREQMGLFELFANQAAMVIDGAHLYSELRATIWQVRESERLKQHFLLKASHELRTPLTAVQGYLELLGDYGDTLDDESKARFVQNARRSCDELVLLLGNVLDAAYLDAAKVVFKPNKVYLATSIRLILEILEPVIVREQRPLEVQIAPDLCLWADELRLRQILLNVLGNALKYTPAGSRIRLKATCVPFEEVQRHLSKGRDQAQVDNLSTKSFVILAVQDWGPGIAIEDQVFLFTKFTHLQTASKDSSQSTGMTLFLCRQLITAMHGAIWMESSGISGEGSTFFLAFPTYRALG